MMYAAVKGNLLKASEERKYTIRKECKSRESLWARTCNHSKSFTQRARTRKEKEVEEGGRRHADGVPGPQLMGIS